MGLNFRAKTFESVLVGRRIYSRTPRSSESRKMKKSYLTIMAMKMKGGGEKERKKEKRGRKNYI